MVPTISHRYLSNLRFRAVITTNYDTLIEEAMPPDQKPYVCLSRDYGGFPRLLQKGDRFLLKIHGDQNEPAGIVIARDDYSEVMHGRETEGLRSALNALFQTSIPVWIGYGHSDPTLDYYVDYGKVALGISNGFAIAKRNEFELENRLRRSRIRLISLSDYDQVDGFLRRLAAACDCKIVFEVRVRVDEGRSSTPSWAKRIGHDLADDLNSRILSGEEVTFWRVSPAMARNGVQTPEGPQVLLHMETSQSSMETLRKYLIDRSPNHPNLLELLRGFKVSALDGLAVPNEDLPNEISLEGSSGLNESSEHPRAVYELETSPVYRLRKTEMKTIDESQYIIHSLIIPR